MRTALIALLLLILCQCTPTATVIVSTHPSRATITSANGERLGLSPLDIDIESSALRTAVNQAGCYDVSGFVVEFDDGEIVEFPELELCGDANGHYLVSIYHPNWSPPKLLGSPLPVSLPAEFIPLRTGPVHYTPRIIDYSNEPDAIEGVWNSQSRNIQSKSDRIEARDGTMSADAEAIAPR